MTEHACYQQLNRKQHFKDTKQSEITAAFLLGQLGESLEAGLGGHQASDGLEMALQLGVESRQLGLLGQKSQDGVVDELLFVLREKTLRRGKRRERSVNPAWDHSEK